MAALPFPDPPLTDGVITLRMWSPDDAEECARVFNDPKVFEWSDQPPEYTAEIAAADLARDEQRRQRGERVPFAIVDSGGHLLGGCDYNPIFEDRSELGYALGAHARGRGVATRAVRLVSQWAFRELRAARIEMPIPVGNTASRAVAERAGYSAEGTLRSYLAVREGGPRHDVVMYALLPGDSQTPE